MRAPDNKRCIARRWSGSGGWRRLGEREGGVGYRVVCRGGSGVDGCGDGGITQLRVMKDCHTPVSSCPRSGPGIASNTYYAILFNTYSAVGSVSKDAECECVAPAMQ